MFRWMFGIGMAVAFSAAAWAVEPFPASFKTQTIKTNGTELYVRVGGKGPAVVMLHGFGDTGDMWAPIAAKLVADHTVIVPDLRGMGLSAHPDAGYTKVNEARDIAGVMDALKVDKSVLVVEAPKHDNRNLELSARNIDGLELVRGNEVHPYHLLRHDRVIISHPAIEKLQVSLLNSASKKQRQTGSGEDEAAKKPVKERRRRARTEKAAEVA